MELGALRNLELKAWGCGVLGSHVGASTVEEESDLAVGSGVAWVQSSGLRVCFQCLVSRRVGGCGFEGLWGLCSWGSGFENSGPPD